MPTTQTAHDDRTPAWMPLVAVALGALLLGFAAGWILRGDGGEATVLRAASDEQLSPAKENSAPVEPVVDPSPTISPATARPRSEVDITVLNGSGADGLAGQVSEQLLDTGYRSAAADNGPTTPGPSVVYFTSGNRPEAARLRRDMQLSAPVQPLADGPIRDIAPEKTQLVVLLGSG